MSGYDCHKDGVKYTLEVVEDFSGGEPQNSSDRWTSYDDTVISASFVKLHPSASFEGFSAHDVEASSTSPLDTSGGFAYLVVTRYGHGGTFAVTRGDWIVNDVFDNHADAYAAARAIERAHKANAGAMLVYSVEVDGVEYSLAGTDYFGGLESVDVEAVPFA